MNNDQQQLEQLHGYINTQRSEGVSDQGIFQSLLAAGWPQELAYQALQPPVQMAANYPVVEQPQQAQIGDPFHHSQQSMADSPANIGQTGRHTLRGLLTDVFKSFFSAPHFAVAAIISGLIGGYLSTKLSNYILINYILPSAFGSILGGSLISSILYTILPVVVVVVLSAIFSIPMFTLSQNIGVHRSSVNFHGNIASYVLRILIFAVIASLVSVLLFILVGFVINLAGNTSEIIILLILLLGVALGWLLAYRYLMAATVLFFEDRGLIKSFNRARRLVGRAPKRLMATFSLLFTAICILMLLVPYAAAGGFKQFVVVSDPVTWYLNIASQVLIIFLFVSVAQIYLRFKD